MKIIISNSSSVPIYEQIKNAIINQIINGELAEDEALPSIRSLASDIKISVMTIKKAYDELESEGYIVSIQGKGTFVAPKNTELAREQAQKDIEDHIQKAIDIANNESDIFTFIIDTIPPKILKIDTHIISQVNYQTTRQKIKIIASEIVSGYIYNDDDFITALETETDQFEITLKKGINKICLVDISGKTSETYYIEYNPTFFQDSELMLYVFTSLAGGLILIIVIVYVFKTRKKLKFEDNI